jgi:hypothetical protein
MNVSTGPLGSGPRIALWEPLLYKIARCHGLGQIGLAGIISRAWVEHFLRKGYEVSVVSKMSTLVLRPTKPPVQWAPGTEQHSLKADQ